MSASRLAIFCRQYARPAVGPGHRAYSWTVFGGRLIHAFPSPSDITADRDVFGLGPTPTVADQRVEVVARTPSGRMCGRSTWCVRRRAQAGLVAHQNLVRAEGVSGLRAWVVPFPANDRRSKQS